MECCCRHHKASLLFCEPRALGVGSLELLDLSITLSSLEKIFFRLYCQPPQKQQIRKFDVHFFIFVLKRVQNCQITPPTLLSLCPSLPPPPSLSLSLSPSISRKCHTFPVFTLDISSPLSAMLPLLAVPICIFTTHATTLPFWRSPLDTTRLRCDFWHQSLWLSVLHFCSVVSSLRELGSSLDALS